MPGGSAANDAPMPRTARVVLIPLGLLAFGFASDRLLLQPLGIGVPLLTAAALVLFAIIVRPRPRASSWLFLGAGLLLALFVSMRRAFWLVGLDLMAIWVLTALGATFAREGVVARTTLSEWGRRSLRPLVSLPQGMRILVPRIKISATRQRKVAVLSAVGATTVVVLTFGALLASADPVFADVIGRPFDIELDPDTLTHLAITCTVAVAAATILAAAMRRPVAEVSVEGSTDRRGPLEPWGWTIVLGSAAAVVLAFLAVHLPAMYLDRQQVLARVGLTYADYAREGFAQMVAAAVLTLALVGLMWTWGGRSGSGARIAAMVLIGLNLIVLVSAFHRLHLYEQEFGWTVARLLGHVAIIWLGVVLALTVFALTRRDLGNVAAAMVGLAFVALLAVNLINPEGFIASQNLASDQLDTRYLERLSDDAIPAIVHAIPQSDPLRADALIEGVRSSQACDTRPQPWFSTNVSHLLAVRAASSYC